jgi:hypothetical protein
MSETTIVPRDRITAFETSIQKAVLEADRLGLTLAQCFEPSRFSAKQTVLGRGWLLFIRATDGWCWGLVTSVDDRGHLVLQREAHAQDPPAQPVPKPPAPPPVEPLPAAAEALRQKRIENMAKARAARTSRKAA